MQPQALEAYLAACPAHSRAGMAARRLRGVVTRGVLPLVEVRQRSPRLGTAYGRILYRDRLGGGTTFTGLPAELRALLFGQWYDEIDIRRCHFSLVLGCAALQARSSGRALTATERRLTTGAGGAFPLTSLEALEAEVALEQQARLTPLLAEAALAAARVRAVGSTAATRQEAAAAARKVSKARLPVKQLFSAVINSAPDEWLAAFPALLAPVTHALVRDVQLMRPALRVHPLAAPLARELIAARWELTKVNAACLHHMETLALEAIGTCLASAGHQIGPCVNDSILFGRCSDGPTATSAITAVHRALAVRFDFPLAVKHVAGLASGELWRRAPAEIYAMVRDRMASRTDPSAVAGGPRNSMAAGIGAPQRPSPAKRRGVAPRASTRLFQRGSEAVPSLRGDAEMACG